MTKLSFKPVDLLTICNLRHDNFGLFAKFLDGLKDELGNVVISTNNIQPLQINPETLEPLK